MFDFQISILWMRMFSPKAANGMDILNMYRNRSGYRGRYVMKRGENITVEEKKKIEI